MYLYQCKVGFGWTDGGALGGVVVKARGLTDRAALYSVQKSSCTVGNLSNLT